jgi:hypothetical protein
MGPRAIGPTTDLHLKHAELDAHLKDGPTVSGADFSSDHLAGLRVIRPTLERVV